MHYEWLALRVCKRLTNEEIGRRYSPPCGRRLTEAAVRDAVKRTAKSVVSQFDSCFRGPFGPGLAGFGARASTNRTIHSASCSWVVRPAAIAGVMRSVL